MSTVMSDADHVNNEMTDAARKSAGADSWAASGLSPPSVPPADLPGLFPDTPKGRECRAYYASLMAGKLTFPYSEQWQATLGAALIYGARGWRCLPLYGRHTSGACTCKLGARCKQAGKHPCLKQWQTLASTDPLVLLAWWRAWRGKPINIGIATGAEAGIFVIDPDGKDGAAALAQIEAEDGALPKTPRQITGSGGIHLAFAWPADGTMIRNSAKSMGTDLDVRGEGGYICAWPSVHPSGRRYRWALPPWQCDPALPPANLTRRAYEATKANRKKTPSAPRKPRAKAATVPGDPELDPFGAEAGRSGCGGFEFHLWSIGDHAGGKGYDSPINSAALAYFGIMGPGAPAEPLKAAILERCAAHGPRAPDKIPIDRYTGDEYLDNRIEQARQHVAKSESAAHSGGFDYE